VNPQATTGWLATGGVLSVVDDSTALATGLAENFGPNVVELANASGSTQYLYGGAVAAAVPHCLSTLARLTAGSGCEIGWRDSSTGAFTKAGDVLDGYATRTIVNNTTPLDVDEQFAILVPNGATIRCIGQQAEAGTVSTSIIPNWATAATATRAAETFDLALDPPDTQGSILASVTPLGWSGGDIGSDCRIITRAGGASGLLIAEDTTGGYEVTDGTNTVTEATVPIADGVEQDVRVRWHEDVGLSVDVDGSRSDGAYDDTLEATGVVRVAPDQAEVAVKNLRVYRNGSG
jgi:hypothetical protein